MHNPKIHAGQTGQVQDRLHHGAPKWLKWTEGTSHTASRGLLLRGPHRYISIQASSAFRPRCHRQSQPQQIGHPRQATLCHALEVVLAHKCTHVQGRGLGAGKNAGLFGTDFATQLALCWDEMRWLRWHGKSGYISNPLVQMHVMTLLPQAFLPGSAARRVFSLPVPGRHALRAEISLARTSCRHGSFHCQGSGAERRT